MASLDFTQKNQKINGRLSLVQCDIIFMIIKYIPHIIIIIILKLFYSCTDESSIVVCQTKKRCTVTPV